MDYINNGSESSLVQGVLKRSLQNYKLSVYKTTNKGQSIPKHCNGSDHHLWVPKTKVALLAFSHHKELSLTFSNSSFMVTWTLLKSLLLRSFHKIHTHSNQRSCIKDRRVLYFYEILIKTNLILIKIICIDNRYFLFSYYIKLYLSFLMIPTI